MPVIFLDSGHVWAGRPLLEARLRSSIWVAMRGLLAWPAGG
jgi:hypothetical protein